MKPQHGNRLPDPLREVFIVKRWVQVGVYLGITLPLVPYYFFLAFNILQLSVWFGVALAIATVAIEGTFWYMMKLRKQSAYPNILAIKLGTAQDLREACDLSTRLVADWLHARGAVLAWLDEETHTIPGCSYGLSLEFLGVGAVALDDAPFGADIIDCRAVLIESKYVHLWAGL